MVQLIPAAKTKPSFSEKLSGAIGTGLNMAGEYSEKNKQAEALKGQGLDPNLPERFNEMAYQYKLNRQQKLDELKFQKDLYDKESQARKSVDSISNPNPLKNVSPIEKLVDDNKKNNKRLNPLPVLNPDQIIQQGYQRAQKLRDQNIPVSDQEMIQELALENQSRMQHNQYVENEDNKIRQRQEHYGNAGVNKLSEGFLEASTNLKSLFREKGQELAESGKSEAEIERILSDEVRDVKNNYARVKRSVPPKRLLNGVVRDILGTSRKDLKQQEDIKISLNPLLEKGLYDEARTLLADLGYEIEERETLVSSLGESAKKELAQLPKFEKKSTFFDFDKPNVQYSPLPEKQKEKLNSSLLNILKSDPATNLILLRKAYEDKGIDWEDFKDSLNESMLSGEIKLNEEQSNHLTDLETPPLNNLDKIFNFFKFSGR